MKACLLEGVLSETTRKIQDFLSFKKSVPGKRCAEEDFGIINKRAGKKVAYLDKKGDEVKREFIR